MFCSQEQYTGIRLEHKSEVTQAIENAVNIFLARDIGRWPWTRNSAGAETNRKSLQMKRSVRLE